MCDDGGDAPDPPDFGPLADAMKLASEQSFEWAKEQFEWAKKTYGENKQVGDLITDFAMGQMDKAAAWADADRARYEDIYQPLEEQAAVRAQDYASAERQELEAGKAEADVAAQFEQSRRAAQDRLESFGVDPSQTRAGALDLGTRVAEAAAQASAGNAARFRTEQYGDQLTANAINTGKGYPQQVMGAYGGAGQSGNQAVNTPLAVTTSGANTMGTPGSWQGLGQQGLASAGQLLNAGYQNELAQFQANQQSSSGFGDILGLAASFIPGFQEGGAIPDEEGGMIPIEASPSGGAIPDDIDAEIEGGQPAKLNAGEFVMPKDVVKWLGEKGMQQFILKARKEMGSPDQAPAQPEMGPAPIPPRGIAAIPDMEGV
jgi:hypothetical protein